MRHFFWHLVWVGLSSALTSSPSDLANFICHIIWLVVYLPLWKIWKSVGMIIPIYYWKKNVPNHQPVIYNDSSWPFCWRVFSKTLNHVGNMWGTCGENVGKMWGIVTAALSVQHWATQAMYQAIHQRNTSQGHPSEPLGMVQKHTPILLSCLFQLIFFWYPLVN